MHDTVINNAFFALLAVGGAALTLMAVSQVVLPEPTVLASAEMARHALFVLVGV